MEQEHRKAIQANFISLVEQTDLDTMVSSLFEKGVFSEQMIEPYKDSCVDERTRKRALYMDVMRRGPQAFDLLLEALSEAGYWNLVRYLDPNSTLHSHVPPRSSNPLPKSESRDNGFVSLSNSKIIGTHNKNPINSSSAAAHSGASSSNQDNNTACVPVEIEHHKVIKSTSFVEDNNKDFKLYPTGGRIRGVLVVFSYSQFNNDVNLNRSGVDKDTERLKHLFKEIGFRVHFCYSNLTYAETLETLRSFADVLSGAECVFVVVSSHGHERAGSADTDVRCSDGRLLSIFSIIEYFNNRNLPALKGKPKVFVFQLCRGDQDDWIGPSSSSVQLDGGAASAASARNENRVATDGIFQEITQQNDDDKDVTQQNRLYSDILIAHSTLPGLVSHRTAERGSWYIQTLCRVFAARAHDCHVEDLFTLVDEELHRTFRYQTSSVEKWGFNRRLYLYPGLIQ